MVCFNRICSYALYYLKTSVNTEFSNNFGKINLEFDYRKLLKGNRQFQARVFLGKFFWNNDRFDNFKYNLGRSGGYLFLDKNTLTS